MEAGKDFHLSAVLSHLIHDLYVSFAFCHVLGTKERVNNEEAIDGFCLARHVHVLVAVAVGLVAVAVAVAMVCLMAVAGVGGAGEV